MSVPSRTIPSHVRTKMPPLPSPRKKNPTSAQSDRSSSPDAAWERALVVVFTFAAQISVGFLAFSLDSLLDSAVAVDCPILALPLLVRSLNLYLISELLLPYSICNNTAIHRTKGKWGGGGGAWGSSQN
jgi:hypothetical protein